MELYYEEGDRCPKCEKEILIITQDNQTGINYLKCQGCYYDATDDERE